MSRIGAKVPVRALAKHRARPGASARSFKVAEESKEHIPMECPIAKVVVMALDRSSLSSISKSLSINETVAKKDDRNDGDYHRTRKNSERVVEHTQLVY
ncbi:hypothetical protein Nepgr_028574 [Nepenthes gracilis]|uniref:Uncharacterized protein n=1 Tax=Nepenthes gracilis TaxID=150966 RepID=A0AAD3Y4P7_NEPGR|nr:hypothetical protein Nepgr_028574 [Nepenthes gracilis]